MRSPVAVRLVLAVALAALLPGRSALAVTSAPVLNNNQPVLNSGSTLTLSWTAPAAGTPTSYLVEASSAPGGPANLASFNTGSTQTSLVVPGVPDGVYYVRVRGVDGSGASAPSNEVQVIVGTIAVCPSAPRAFAAAAGGNTVSLSWQAPASGTTTSYVLQAGTAPGLANLVNTDLGSTALGFAAGNVPPGTYYLRVLARGPACAAPTFAGPASNEVALTVGTAALGAPVLNNNLPVQSSGPTLTLSWAAPASGVPTSYLVEAAITPGGAAFTSFNTGNALTSVAIPNVPAGTYYIRVRGVDAAGPGPASNEVALTVGATPSWSGVIQCQSQISGNGYNHHDTQRWVIGLPATVSGPRTTYTALWSATGSGGNAVRTWTINQSQTIDFSATVIASNQLTGFDRTSTGLVIPNGMVATPGPNFTHYEMDFPPFFTATPSSTLVTGTYSRPTVGGDSPQQPGDASGTLTCTWTLRLQ